MEFDKIYSSFNATVSFSRPPAPGGVFEKELRGGG